MVGRSADLEENNTTLDREPIGIWEVVLNERNGKDKTRCIKETDNYHQASAAVWSRSMGTKKEEETIEMRMLRRMKSVTLRDREREERQN